MKVATALVACLATLAATVAHADTPADNPYAALLTEVAAMKFNAEVYDGVKQGKYRSEALPCITHGSQAVLFPHMSAAIPALAAKADIDAVNRFLVTPAGATYLKWLRNYAYELAGIVSPYGPVQIEDSAKVAVMEFEAKYDFAIRLSGQYAHVRARKSAEAELTKLIEQCEYPQQATAPAAGLTKR